MIAFFYVGDFLAHMRNDAAEVSLLAVGGGPAGITAAVQPRELGARVTLLEAHQVGGTSLNRGPAPVRTLARAARLALPWERT